MKTPATTCEIFGNVIPSDAQEAFGWHDLIERKPECAAQVLVRHLVMGDAYYAVANYDIVGNTNKFTEANKGVKEFVLNVTHWCHIMHLD